MPRMANSSTTMHNHTIHQHQSHFGWNRDNPPAARIAPGESVEFHPVDSSGGQLSPDSTVADIARLDFGRLNPVAGPIHVDGAEPGDVIKVTLLSFAPSGWGRTGNTPGVGRLAPHRPEPAPHMPPH